MSPREDLTEFDGMLPGGEELDRLLRTWHEENRRQAATGRDRLMATLSADTASTSFRPAPRREGRNRRIVSSPRSIRAIALGVYARAGACAMLFAVLTAMLLPIGRSTAQASEVIQAPEGGRLEAYDVQGRLIGPCPPAHTAVEVDIAGPFTRVNVRQVFRNIHPLNVEAVYTFPLSQRAAVDRMVMTVRGPDGERVVVGEMQERSEAERVYESARESGYVAGLLEQERPNVFTQSIANIEPGSTVTVDIGYIETLRAVDGEYRFDFPMMVGPRYTPGSGAAPSRLPQGLRSRYGVVLLGPAEFAVITGIDHVGPAQAAAALAGAVAIDAPEEAYWARSAQGGPQIMADFTARYGDGAAERGRIYHDGTGQINGRWFYADPDSLYRQEGSFAIATDQGPEAGRITPTPLRPPVRAGHDVSLRVRIDTGNSAVSVTGVRSLNHAIAAEGGIRGGGPQSRAEYRLANAGEIPNLDFVLQWRTTAGSIQDGVFVHTLPRVDGAASDQLDGYFTLVLNPPDRVEDAEVRPRELIFVVDTSDAMSGFPLEKSKEAVARVLRTMRPADTFNVIRFAGSAQVLWAEPRPATPESLNQAQLFIAAQPGSGGTDMMAAITAALVQTSPSGLRAASPPTRICMILTSGQVSDDQQVIQAVRDHSGATRVFAFGIGNGVNHVLLEQIAFAGRGAAEFVQFESDADAAIHRFERGVRTPLLTDVEVTFSEGLQVHDLLSGSGPALEGRLPDLLDQAPLVLHGRYGSPGKGRVTIRGRTGAGRYERTLDVELAPSGLHDMLPALWARAAVDRMLAPYPASVEQQAITPEVRTRVVDLGVRYGVMTPYTSFVAVERERMTIGGQPMLVHVPVELREGLGWDAFFAGEAWKTTVERLAQAGIDPFQAVSDKGDWFDAWALRPGTAGRKDAADPGPAALGPKEDAEVRLPGGLGGDQAGETGSPSSAEGVALHDLVDGVPPKSNVNDRLVPRGNENARAGERGFAASAWRTSAGTVREAVERYRGIDKLKEPIEPAGARDTWAATPPSLEVQGGLSVSDNETLRLGLPPKTESKAAEVSSDGPAPPGASSVSGTDAPPAPGPLMGSARAAGRGAQEAHPPADPAAASPSAPEAAAQPPAVTRSSMKQVPETAAAAPFAGGRRRQDGRSRPHEIDRLEERTRQLINEGDGEKAKDVAEQLLFLDPLNHAATEIRKALAHAEQLAEPAPDATRALEKEAPREASDDRHAVAKDDRKPAGAARNGISLAPGRSAPPAPAPSSSLPRAAVEPPPAAPSGGAGGGGGSLFGSAEETRRSYEFSPDDEEERAEELVELLTEFVHPEAWTINGGDQLAVERLGRDVRIVARGADPEVIRQKEEAERFLGEYAPIFFPSASIARPSQPHHSGYFDDEGAAAALERLATTLVAPLPARPVKDQLTEIGRRVGLPIVLDKETEEQWRDELNEPRALEVAASALAAFELLLPSGAVAANVEDGVVVVSLIETRSEERLTILYDVRDLLEPVPAMREYRNDGSDPMGDHTLIHHLLNIVQEVVQPELWRDNGGDHAGIDVLDGRLLIQADAFVQRQVQTLLGQIRAAMGLPLDPRIVEPVRRRQSLLDLDERWQHTVVVFDVSAIAHGTALENGVADDPDHGVELLIDAMQEGIFPEDWKDNGGELASLQVFRSIMILAAPSRIAHEADAFLAARAFRQGAVLERLRPIPEAPPAYADDRAGAPTELSAATSSRSDILDDPMVRRVLGAPEGARAMQFTSEELVIASILLERAGDDLRAAATAHAAVERDLGSPLARRLVAELCLPAADPLDRPLRLGLLEREAVERLGRSLQAPNGEPAASPVQHALQELPSRLDEQLLAAALAHAATGASQPPITRGAEAERVLVTLAVERTDPDMLRSLRDAGLEIEDVSDAARLVAGRARLDWLMPLAAINGVRRIEPTRSTPLPGE